MAGGNSAGSVRLMVPGGAGGAAAHSASFAGRVVETFNTGHWSAWSPLPAGENIERAVISGVFPNRQYIT